MNNIEKFKKLKELTVLRSELHKREIATFFTIDRYTKGSNSKWNNMGSYVKMGYSIFKNLGLTKKNN